MEPFYDTCFMCFCLGTKTNENFTKKMGKPGRVVGVLE